MTPARDGQAEFLDLIYQYQGILVKISTIYAHGAVEANDLIQDMLIQLWQSYPTFKGQSSFSTWMYRIALNTALMYRRKYARRPEGHIDPNPPPEFMTYQPELDEDVQLLYECIRELPSLDRAIILLYLEQYRYQEIADITGLSHSNVSVRIVRIKSKLKTLLTAKGYCEE
ncbi:sigma-70 family RNA polymerase sigma factor [candidate division KSB1 bacterium]|nr:sigma-70 family RNA polymerase sigma factor [candidate division KSB1 bacterium]